MDLNEFLVINTKTKLDDLDIMINELNVLILLCQKTLSLKKLGIENGIYKRELLDFIKVDQRAFTIDEFHQNSEISLIALNTYKSNQLLTGDNIERKLLLLFYINKKYWNDERYDELKVKMSIINDKIDELTHILMRLFFG